VRGDREDHHIGALECKDRAVDEVRECCDGVVDHSVEHHGAADLQHPELAGPGPPTRASATSRGPRDTPP
jgi:hypothetical protein